MMRPPAGIIIVVVYLFIYLFIYLAHYTVIHNGYGATSGQNYKTVQNLPYLLDYFNY